MSLLSQRKIEIPEVRYRADMELHDRFQSFSAELLKLSLTGIAAIGFFLALIDDGKPSKFADALDSRCFLIFIGLSVSMFAISAAFALGHRFLASDGMFHHLRAIKYLIVKENIAEHTDLRDDLAAIEELSKRAKKDEDARTAKFRLSGLFLYASAAAIVLGAAVLGASFVQLLRA